MLEKYLLVKVIKGIIRERNEFGVREVARKLKISPSASKQSLDFLLKKGVIERGKFGKSFPFRVKDNFLTRHMRIIYSLTELSNSGVVEELLKKNQGILSISLYGSVAKGEDDKNSDIDLLIVSRKNINIKVEPLKGEEFLERELAILNYSYNEWRRKAEKDPVFYKDVILNCIQLYGEKPVVL